MSAPAARPREGASGVARRFYTTVVARVRGITVLGTVRFVKETYGPEAHEKVLAALPAQACAVFLGPLRDASWVGLKDLMAYTEEARKLLAADDPEFWRKLGGFIGRFERDKGGFRPMVADPATAMRLAGVMWSALYDSGRLEIVVQGPREALARIHGFRTNRDLCQTNCAAMEGLLSTDHHAAHAEETACVLDGGPYCEMRLVWE